MLDEEDQAILREPRFWIRRPERWRRHRHAGRAAHAGGRPGSRWPSCLCHRHVRRHDPRRRRPRRVALQAFIRTLEVIAVDVVIVPGRLVLIDNRCMLHGRRVMRRPSLRTALRIAGCSGSSGQIGSSSSVAGRWVIIGSTRCRRADRTAGTGGGPARPAPWACLAYARPNAVTRPFHREWISEGPGSSAKASQTLGNIECPDFGWH